MALFPKQRIPKSQKTEDWGIDTIKAIVQLSSFSRQSKVEIEKLYRAYGGDLDETDYNYVLNPYNSQERALRRFPARIRNYNIIAPLVNLLMGEKSKRPVNFQVVALNPDAEDARKEFEFELLLENLSNALSNAVAERGITNEPQQPVDSPEEVEEKLQGYRDARAEAGHNLLEYLYHYLDVKDQNQKAFLDWLVAGEVYSYKGVSFSDVEREIVSPVDIDFSLGENMDFVEDSDWVIRRARMTINQAVDAFHDLLTPENIDALEMPGATNGGGMNFFLPFLSTDRDIESKDERFVDVLHIWWKSFKKVGVLTKAIDGEEVEIEIDETYKTEKGDRVVWSWISEGWEGYQLNGNIYIGVGPAPLQRRSLTNPSKIKAPYNGRRYRSRFVTHNSVVRHALIYQILYNIYHYRLELTVAKNKGKIALMEFNTIPKKAGWTEDKFIYYAEAMNFAFIDSTAEGDNGKSANFNQYQVLDLSLGTYLNTQMELLSAIKEELEDSLGINRQRKGQLHASDAVGTTERSVFQSATMSEEIFRMFEKWEEKEYQGLLDIGKYAYADGKKATYVGLDQSIKTLNLEPNYLQEADLGVFATISSDEKERLEALRGLSLEFAQNGVSAPVIAEIIEAKSFSKIKKLLTKAEKARQAYEMSLKQMEAEQAQALQEAQQQAVEEQRDYDSSENMLDREHEIALKELELSAEGLIKELDLDQKRDAKETDKVLKEEDLAQRKQEAEMNYRLKLKDLAVKAKSAASKSTTKK
jgi:hypothetical protein